MGVRLRKAVVSSDQVLCGEATSAGMVDDEDQANADLLGSHQQNSPIAPNTTETSRAQTTRFPVEAQIFRPLLCAARRPESLSSAV